MLLRSDGDFAMSIASRVKPQSKARVQKVDGARRTMRFDAQFDQSVKAIIIFRSGAEHRYSYWGYFPTTNDAKALGGNVIYRAAMQISRLQSEMTC